MAQPQPNRETFRQAIHEIALRIQGGRVKSKLNEAAVRQTIVLRLLQAAGFDIWNPLEVAPEEVHSSGGYADLSIRANGQLLFVLELKRLNSSIKDKETEQTVNYANSKAIRWALATNGVTWCVYDAHLVNQPSIQRLVLEIALTQGNQDEFADDLYSLLDASVWAKNGFENAVNQLRQDQELRNVIAKKTSALEKFMDANTVVDREKAIALMLQLNQLEQADADALRGNTAPRLVTKDFQHAATKTLLICEGRDGAYATALLLENGWLEVQVGSVTARSTTERFAASSKKKWNKDRDALVLRGQAKIRPDGALEYSQAVQYKRPSTASALILGRSSSGWTDWKTQDGKEYAEVVEP